MGPARGPAVRSRGRCGGGAGQKVRSRTKAVKNFTTGLWFGLVWWGMGSRTNQGGADRNCCVLCVDLGLLLKPLRLKLTFLWCLLVGRCSFATFDLSLQLRSSEPAAPPPQTGQSPPGVGQIGRPGAKDAGPDVGRALSKDGQQQGGQLAGIGGHAAGGAGVLLQGSHGRPGSPQRLTGHPIAVSV